MAGATHHAPTRSNYYNHYPYRAIYVTIVKGKVVVLHCFKKTTSKTEKGDVNLANKRLKELLADERKLKK